MMPHDAKKRVPRVLRTWTGDAYAIGRFALQPALQVFVGWTFLSGGAMLWAGGALYAVLLLALDDLSGDDFDVPRSGRPILFDLFVHATFILTLLLTVLLIYLAGRFSAPWLETATGMVTGFDIAAARARTGGADLAGGAITLGIAYSVAAGNSGHELIHRRSRRMDRAVGRWLLAFVFNTPLALEHVYGHHGNVGFADDPTTVRRGVSFWRFLPRTILQTSAYAWRLEARRLARTGRRRFLRNRVLRGHMISLLIALACFAAAGWAGLAVFVAAAAIGRLLVEQFNYCSHYGLVRAPGRPVRARHSWNSFRRLSTSVMFNIPRHASHHLSAGRPYWRLEREPGGPVLPHGIALMAMIALVPPLWYRIIAPALAEWDRAFASAEEKKLLAASRTAGS